MRNFAFRILMTGIAAVWLPLSSLSLAADGISGTPPLGRRDSSEHRRDAARRQGAETPSKTSGISLPKSRTMASTTGLGRPDRPQEIGSPKLSDMETKLNPSSRWEQVHALAATRVRQETRWNGDEKVTLFQLVNQGLTEEVQLRIAVPPTLLHYELEASLRVYSGAPGLRLGFVVTLPHQTDPRTGKPLETILAGDVLRQTNEWQKLTVQASQKNVESQFRRVRADLNRSEIRLHQPVVRAIAVIAGATPGETLFELSEPEIGPVISPPESLMQLITSTDSAGAGLPTRNFIPMDVELGGLTLNHQPSVLRFAPDHGEHLETLRQFGLNAVWIPDCTDEVRAGELSGAGIAVMATPPHPEFEAGNFSRIVRGLPPLDHQCPNVSAWIQGTRVTPDEMAHLIAWSREVRSADRTFQRLQMADVTAAEGAVAREIDLVGIGRHVIGRDLTFGSLRNMLVRRQQNAGQLSFPWTWVQTEPSAHQHYWRTGQGSQLPQIEPEQIRQGVCAAISAGYKGLGFWKTHSLEINNPADREIAIAIELACLEIELLEPFLARGRVEGYLNLQQTREDTVKRNRGVSGMLSATMSGRTVGAQVVNADGPEGPDAAVITSGGNTLIYATAWDRTSQFVPGPLYEREVSMVVAASETASAWQISTTGIQGLPREVTAGGLLLRIRDFNQSAALIVSSNPATLIPELERRIHLMAPRAASRLTELASLKYVRVLSTIEKIREEHTIPAAVDGLMSQSRQMLDRAEFELSAKDFSQAARRAEDSMLFARQAQHLCWQEAVRGVTSPSASPHTISFATLPDHWRLMHYIQQQGFRTTDNLLLSGNFESMKSAGDDGWSLTPPRQSAYSATADLIQDSRSGRLLRLIAWKNDSVQGSVSGDESMPITLTSPPIEVTPGDVLLISGRVRRGRTGTPDARRPLVVFDSELGPECSLRFELDSDWSRFEMIRPIAVSDEFRVSLGLIGQADVEEVHIDNLSIRKLSALPRPSLPDE